MIPLFLAGNPVLLPEHVDALIALGQPEVSLELAREQRLTPAQADLLAGTGRHEILTTLIESENLPIERIPGDDPWALLAAVDRPDAPGDLLPRLASWPDTAVRLALGERAFDRIDIAQLIAGDEDCAVAACAANPWEIPEALAVRLSRRTEACVRVALASKVNIPGAVLAGLVSGAGSPPLSSCPHRPDTGAAMREVRVLAGGNPSTPVAAVLPLTVDPDPALAATLAQRHDLSERTYGSLLAMNEHEVTVRLALNRAVPADLLRRLYDLENGRWRNLVLANPRTPLDLLVRYSRAGGSPPTDYHPDLDALFTLATDPDPRVRLVAAASHRLPADLRTALIEDPDFEVACRALRFYAVPAEQVRAFAERYGPPSFSLVAGHPTCPPDVLLIIATDPSSSAGAIMDVAVNEAATPSALAACLRHPRPAASCVAGNPSTPPDMLIDLASRPDPQVLQELARNPRLPPTAVSRILDAFTGA